MPLFELSLRFYIYGCPTYETIQSKTFVPVHSLLRNMLPLSYLFLTSLTLLKRHQLLATLVADLRNASRPREAFAFVASQLVSPLFPFLNFSSL
jgi:hypothetical protein